MLQVHLVDRALMPGDVVKCLVPGQDTQCGFVMNMDVRCHLHVLRTNKYIYNIDSKDMQPLQVGHIYFTKIFFFRTESIYF